MFQETQGNGTFVGPVCAVLAADYFYSGDVGFGFAPSRSVKSPTRTGIAAEPQEIVTEIGFAQFACNADLCFVGKSQFLGFFGVNDGNGEAEVKVLRVITTGEFGAFYAAAEDQGWHVAPIG